MKKKTVLQEFANWLATNTKSRKELLNVKSTKTVFIVQIFKKQYQKTYQNVTEDDISKTCSKNSIKQLVEHNLDVVPLQKDLQKVISDLNNIAQVAFAKVLKYKGT